MSKVVSPQGRQFITRGEGFVGKTYRDSGGVLTIGYGFTNLSQTFRDYWMVKHGHPLRAGDTITREESDAVLAQLLASEYVPPIVAKFGPDLPQHELDACASVTFNAGAGTLKDKWAAQLAKRAVKDAARLLRSTRITAGGRKLTGLVKRRAAEARLLEFGDYGGSKFKQADEVAAYQSDLETLGYYHGAIDGIHGPATQAAVTSFQRSHGLVVDGIVGPATRAAIRRALDARTAARTTVGGSTAGAAGGTITTPEPAIDFDTLMSAGKWALLVGGFILTAYLLWQFRGVILRRRTPA